MPRPNEGRTVQTRKLEQWYHDPLSCLHTTMATVLAHRDADPLEVLGLRFGFTFIPGHVTREEFYFPGTSEHGLARDLAPFHQISSQWWTPNGDDHLQALYAALKADDLVIAAVDNFQLPYRPAFHDVHAAHLVVIDGIDESRGTISLSDAQPPAWRGHIQLEPFLRAWGSSNPADDQDAFFSDADIERRYLKLMIEDDFAPLTPESLGAAMQTNVDDLLAPYLGTAWTGLQGLWDYVDWLVVECAAGRSDALEDLYAFAWSMQAQAFLHGELLRTVGAAWSDPYLRHVGRAAHTTATRWTNLRILGAHLREQPEQAAPLVRRRGRELHQAYEAAAYQMEAWLRRTRAAA